AARSKARARFTSKKWKCEPTWIGRSPVLVTTSSTVARPAFATMSPSPRTYSPGITGFSSADRTVDGDQLGPVGERALDLHLVDHLGDAFHDVVAAEDGQPGLHQIGHGAAISDAFQGLGRDEGDGLGVIEPEPSRPPTARDLGGGEDEELFLFAWREVHRRTSQTARWCRTASTFRSRVSPRATTAPLAMMT